MIGVAVGDIVGSVYEFSNIKTKKFPFFGKGCEYTDDTVMALAVADAIMSTGKTLDEKVLRSAFISSMRHFGNEHPDPMGGYGGRFAVWLRSPNPQPYNSWGNGSAMRVAACGFAGESISEAYHLARCSAEVTHNHPEGIKGAYCVAGCIWMAKNGWKKEAIKAEVENSFYRLDKSIAEIRAGYAFTESCQGTVPQAIQAFLEAEDFEDAIRNAISVGGDSDTLAAITGGIAEAYYGVPEDIAETARAFLTPDLIDVIDRFEAAYQQ